MLLLACYLNSLRILFSLQFPDLNALIMRRFKGPNDVEEARQAVHKVTIARVKRVPPSFHILSFTIG